MDASTFFYPIKGTQRGEGVKKKGECVTLTKVKSRFDFLEKKSKLRNSERNKRKGMEKCGYSSMFVSGRSHWKYLHKRIL